MADKHRDGMTEQPTNTDSRQPPSESANGHIARLRRHPWVVFLLPFIVFMLVMSLEPTPDKAGGSDIGLSLPYDAYPWVYAAKIIATVLAVVFVLPGYQSFPLRVSPLALLLGVVGAFVWVGFSAAGTASRSTPSTSWRRGCVARGRWSETG